MPQIFLFYGNAFLIQKKVDLWKDEFIKKYGDSNISIFDDAKIATSDIIDTCSCLPFLAEKRLILVWDYFKNAKSEDQKKIADNLENIPETSVLVFIEKQEEPDKRSSLYKKISKIGKIECFQALEGPALTDWIQREIQNREGKISKKNADYLGQHVGNNLWQLNNEIEKLTCYCNGREITQEDIAILTKANLKSTIFRFTDFLGQKNARLSIDTLSTLLESGEDVLYIFHMIIRQFRLLLQIKYLLTQGNNQKNIQTTLKQHPYVVMTTMRQCRNFDLETLKKMYQNLLELDIDTKTGKTRIITGDSRQFNLALEKFILEHCK